MTPNSTDGCLPLSNTVVVELGHSVAAPYAGQILGDLGATVIKVEKPAGGDDARSWGPPFSDGTSTCYLSLNRNKQSVTVNLADPVQLERLREFIVAKADVVLQNLRPGSVQKAGLDAAALRARNARLVYCNLGAFGRTGPLAAMPGYDPLMQAYGGIMGVTGEAGRPPVRVGVSLVDMATGMWAVIGILSAMQRRAVTGHGCEVDVSLYESALAWMTVHVANYTASGELPERLGSGAVITAPYQAFATRDGYLVIAAGNAQLFARLCKLLGHPEWVEDERFRTNEARLQNRDNLAALITVELAAETAQTWIAKLEAAGVPCAPIQDMAQVITAPQTDALGILQTPGEGPLRFVGLPVSFDGARPGLRQFPAGPGEHTEQVFGK